MRTVLLLLLAPLACCQQPGQRSASQLAAAEPNILVIGGAIDDDPANRRIREHLKHPIKGIEGTSTLAEAIDYFRDTTKLNVTVDWQALAAADVHRDFRVPPLEDATAENVLKAMLQSVNKRSVGPIEFAIRDNIIDISIGGLRSQPVTRFYILRPEFWQPANREPMRDVPHLGLGSSLLPFTDPPPALKDIGPPEVINEAIQRISEERIEQLMTLIHDTIGVQSDWRSYGGEVNHVVCYEGVLVVRTTPANHEDLAHLLGKLSQGFPVNWLRQTEVDHLVKRAETLRFSGRRHAAIQLIDNALFVKPEDRCALALKQVLTGALGQQFAMPAPAGPAYGSSPVDERPLFGPPPRTVVRHSERRRADEDQEEAARQIEDRLRRKISIDFNATELSKVIDFFRDESSAPIFVNEALLQSQGLKPDHRITLRLNDVRTGTALKMVLRQVSAAMKEEQADFAVIVNNGSADRGTSVSAPAVLLISTQADLIKADRRRTSVYDVRDLIDWGTDDYSFELMHGRNDRCSVAAMRFERDLEHKIYPLNLEYAAEQVIGLIPAFVGASIDWRSEGGEVASLRDLNGNLIVRAPRTWHRQIEAFLNDLRLARLLWTVRLMRHREALRLLYTADALRMQQRYAEALIFVEEALRTDPNHGLARAMKIVLDETIQRRRSAER